MKNEIAELTNSVKMLTLKTDAIIASLRPVIDLLLSKLKDKEK
ncbi:MAG: hypothetical protein ACTSQE_13130 [Candidatus Heimdallarchaeaceae archaeon]